MPFFNREKYLGRQWSSLFLQGHFQPSFIFPFLSFLFFYFFLFYTRILFFKNKPWFYNWHCCLMSDEWNHLNFESPLTGVHWNQCLNKDIFISPRSSLASQCKLMKVRVQLFWFGALLPQKDEKAQVQTSLLHNSASKEQGGSQPLF